ncbi:Autoinducer 2 sensor kinase/phosphatase LuxQ [Kordia antarctica]|uniref:histidine kinase n=1 Tax=Kordia antarctica TaxID=1218801 RepID=A0A7L4ZRF8_9FLAO|nr:ATP-binding protein [Kordia antarctica]QHI39202.1 Autoinducer 2 sensor kinase/phosphatase LuxQ [Kordia antarctica]
MSSFNKKNTVKEDFISPNTSLDATILIVIENLKVQLKNYYVHYELSAKLKTFDTMSDAHKRDSFPSLYLEVEDFLSLQPNANFDTLLFRQNIKESYPLLDEKDELRTIFIEDNNTQKIILSELFLKDVLIKSKDLLGNFSNPFLIEAENLLVNTPISFETITQQQAASTLKELFEYSNLIQKKIQESLGLNAMLSIYNNAYNTHFSNYNLLENFTITVNLVPEQLLVTENANLPSKGQLHRLLKTQISSLEDINSKLSKEVFQKSQIQEELENNEKLYSAVIHNSLDANVIFNIEGIIIRSNKKAAEFINANEKQLNFYKLLPEQFSKRLRTIINNFSLKTISSLEKELFEFEIYKNGELNYYNLKISPVYINNKMLFFSVIRDITKDIRNMIRIEEARIIAEKSAKAKTTFLSNMSHEIRTPLNVILGLSELFNNKDFTGSESEYENIEAIRFSTENLLMIVNDILDFSKIEAGKLNVQKVDFNFTELIYNLNKGFKLKAEEKGLDFSMNIMNSIPKYVVGDQYRLSQILNNLIGNAIKFTQKGFINVHITAKELANKTIQVYFTIEDSGNGISKDNLQTIFESFYQSHHSDEKPEGTGLGLSITKELVTLLGGELMVKSELNVGTVFSFDVNYTVSNLSDLELQNTQDVNHNLRNKKILVAEDNKLNQLFIKQLLKKWDAETTIVENGQEAVEIVKTQDFDLILMDIQMPVLDGLEATSAIRALDSDVKKNIPIVACSADVFPESRQKAEEAGVNYYVTKPISAKSINEILYLLTTGNS